MPDEGITVQDEADQVLINGASDDLIYVEGAVEEEFRPGLEVEDEGVFLALSCGVLLKVRYDGNWIIRLRSGVEDRDVLIEHGDAHGHTKEGVREYSDYMLITAESIEWALMGQHAAPSEA